MSTTFPHFSSGAPGAPGADFTNTPCDNGVDHRIVPSRTTALTGHAHVRARQRNFSSAEVEYVLRYGRMIRRTGVCFYFLGEKDVPPSDRRLPWVQRVTGATLLVASDGTAVITLYKNQNALKDIKKKSKYRRAA